VHVQARLLTDNRGCSETTAQARRIAIRKVTTRRQSVILRGVSSERNVSEQERLDRIERHIKQLAEASAALQRELAIARQLAAERDRASRSHISPTSEPSRKKKRR
jgi:hypothetical protein